MEILQISLVSNFDPVLTLCWASEPRLVQRESNSSLGVKFQCTGHRGSDILKYHFLRNARSLEVFKSFFCYGVRLGTKSIITFRIVCFSCVKQQKVPAIDEITG